jgi:hypothetical protein
VLDAGPGPVADTPARAGHAAEADAGPVEARAAGGAGPDLPSRGGRWLRRLRGAVAVAVPTAVAAAHASLYGRWEVDDAGITFAYARSVATGAGPVLQPGAPPVEGFSDPTWMALLAFGHRLGLFDHGTWFGVPDYVAYPKTLAIALLAVVFSAFLAMATAVARHPAAVTAVAGCACALIPSFVIWSVSGLENSLLAAAVAVQVALVVRRRDRLAAVLPALACGLLAALAALTRPEGAVYAATYPLALLLVGSLRWRELGAAALSVVAFAVPFGAYLAWRLATFGQWLPTTAVAKSQGLPTVAGFAKVDSLIAYAGWPIVLVGALLVGAALAGAARPAAAGSAAGTGIGPAATTSAGAAAGSAASTAAGSGTGVDPTAATTGHPGATAADLAYLAAIGRPVARTVPRRKPTPPPPTGVGTAVALILIPLGLALAAFGVLVPDWMEQFRFATPVWTLGPFAVVLAGDEVLSALRWRGRVIVAGVTAAAAAFSVAGFVPYVQTFRDNPTAPMCLIVTNTGREFNGYMDVLGLASATFFAPEIGGAALTGRALLYDGGGLAEPTIARFWAAKDTAGIRNYVLDDVKPTFIRAHGSFRPFIGLDADPRFARDYVEIGTFSNGGANWVRRELVPDPATLARLQAWGATALAADAAQRATPRASCGDRLLVGPTTA